jgi:hypothetical protein
LGARAFLARAAFRAGGGLFGGVFNFGSVGCLLADESDIAMVVASKTEHRSTFALLSFAQLDSRGRLSLRGKLIAQCLAGL